ncbi:MAG: HD domain-containing protein, partial [Acidaminococcaceae bacterium]
MKSIEDTKAYLLLKSRNSQFLNQVEKLYKYADDFLPKINRLFANYTGHGIIHSFNVADYMFEIIEQPELLSDLEIVVLIYAALLHDIGMAVNESEIASIKNDMDILSNRKYSLVYEKYKNEILALQECIRPIHGKRSYHHVMGMDAQYFILPGSTTVSFQEDVAKVCAAHNENFEWISANILFDQRKGEWSLNSQYIAMLLRIADYLDIDEERAPFYLYQYLSPKDYGDLEWKQHFVIENKDKIYIDEKTEKKRIEIYGESANPEIHRKLLKYFDAINSELKNAIDYSETFRDKKYLLSLGATVHNKIRPKGFAFSDFRLSLDYKAVTNLLMGENIYGDEKYGLRELIQNSIDACMIMLEESTKKPEFKYNSYKPFINIILDKERKQAIIYDNGKGMSIDILKKYFLNVGVSYYVSDEYIFQGNKYCPIGNYGIGFLACFMLSDTVFVITKHYGENQTNKIAFEKSSEYICLTFEETARSQGTEIILDYDKFISVFDNKESDVEKFIKENFVDCSIPISLLSCKDGNTITNLIELKKIETFYPQSIRLDNYFDDMEVAIQFNYKGIQYLKKFSDIYGDESLIYQEKDGILFREESFSSPVLLK